MKDHLFEADCAAAEQELDRLYALNAELVRVLAMVEVGWSSALAARHGGAAADQREPILNAIRAVLARAKEQT